MKKVIFVLSVFIILLTITTTSVGLFWEDDGESFYMENVSGDSVQIFGNGLYAHESYHKAPINKGTDAIILFIVVPLFIITLFLLKKDMLSLKLLHLGLLSCLLYYSASIAFGVSYNILFLAYLLLFSSCLFAFILGISTIDPNRIEGSKLPYKSIVAFLVIAGLSVFVWLIEIIGSIKTGLPPGILGISTTEPTFIMDIGIIAPCAFSSAWLVYKRKPLGYVFAIILLTLNAIIGLIVISQSIFQNSYGVGVDLEKMIPYVGVFVVMSLVATVINVKTLRKLNIR